MGLLSIRLGLIGTVWDFKKIEREFCPWKIHRKKGVCIWFDAALGETSIYLCFNNPVLRSKKNTHINNDIHLHLWILFRNQNTKIPCNLHPSGRICGSTHSTYFYIYLYIMDIRSLQHNNRSNMKTLTKKNNSYPAAFPSVHLYICTCSILTANFGEIIPNQF